MEANTTEVTVKLDLGNVKNFVRVARSFESDVDLLSDRAVVDAKSILGVYALNISENLTTRIISDNQEECNRFITEMKQFM